MILFIFFVVGTLSLLSACIFFTKHQGPLFAVGIFASLYVIANILATKLIQIGPFTVTAGILTYSLTFFLTDYLSEFYGKKIAKKAIWAGFLSQIILVFSIFVSLHIDSSPFWPHDDAFRIIFANAPRIVVASFVTYLLTQYHDVWAFDYWKKKTGGRHLWIRNNASTIVSQAIDSFLFAFLAFYGSFPINSLLELIVGMFILKTIIALLDTPFLYLVRYYNKKSSF
ncbi:MAG: queuosine precursor transporter [Candidatus Woesearchaeota archaeon]|nr:MAG: queuosine precursor transporter [Candidatus Woesearchaeota archaeon]